MSKSNVNGISDKEIYTKEVTIHRKIIKDIG